LEEAGGPPKHLGRWSCRTIAKAAGLPKATAQPLPAANDIKPHVRKTFKVSHDPALVEKVWDVIGLGSLRRPAFLAEKVLGNVVSSGVKVLVLAVTIDVVFIEDDRGADR
jgi:hypothetical protein